MDILQNFGEIRQTAQIAVCSAIWLPLVVSGLLAMLFGSSAFRGGKY